VFCSLLNCVLIDEYAIPHCFIPFSPVSIKLSASEHIAYQLSYTVNSKSKRCLDSLKEAPYYERSFVFGFYAPTLSYCLMIGMMFGFICPLMLG